MQWHVAMKDIEGVGMVTVDCVRHATIHIDQLKDNAFPTVNIMQQKGENGGSDYYSEGLSMTCIMVLVSNGDVTWSAIEIETKRKNTTEPLKTKLE